MPTALYKRSTGIEPSRPLKTRFLRFYKSCVPNFTGFPTSYVEYRDSLQLVQVEIRACQAWSCRRSYQLGLDRGAKTTTKWHTYDATLQLLNEHIDCGECTQSSIEFRGIILISSKKISQIYECIQRRQTKFLQRPTLVSFALLLLLLSIKQLTLTNIPRHVRLYQSELRVWACALPGQGMVCAISADATEMPSQRGRHVGHMTAHNLI